MKIKQTYTDYRTVFRARNRFDIAPQALLLSVGVILSIVLISIMLVQFEQARTLSSVVSENMISTTERIRNSEVLQYDGLQVNGAEVRNFYKLHLNETGRVESISIINGQKSFTFTDSDDYSKLTDSEEESYVNPIDVYQCRVEKNANGIITNVQFTKKQ